LPARRYRETNGQEPDQDRCVSTVHRTPSPRVYGRSSQCRRTDRALGCATLR
jgi:hypothetical protein